MGFFNGVDLFEFFLVKGFDLFQSAISVQGTTLNRGDLFQVVLFEVFYFGWDTFTAYI